MTLTLVIVGGMVILLVLAVCVGVSLDTEAQRRERRRLAEVRRDLHGHARRGQGVVLCERCPYRNGHA